MRHLKTDIWVTALIRRAHSGGAFATIAHRGDPDAGDIMIKTAYMDGKAALYAPSWGHETERVFINLTEHNLSTDESAIDAYINKRRQSDPDLWVVEIEDTKGRHFLTEKVEDKSCPPTNTD